MKKYPGSFRSSGAYTSPGTPEYGGISQGEFPKGWCSERVALPGSSFSSRRHISAAALIPFNSGRVLPSKWDDAERWISSPVSGLSPFKTPIAQPQRQPMSKSGPLGSPGIEDGRMKHFMGNSPLTTGVLAPHGFSIHYDGRIGVNYSSLYSENNISRSTSVPGLSDLLSEPSVHSSQDDMIEAEMVLRKDMATQMSPRESTHSSSVGRLSFSILPSSALDQSSNLADEYEVRDVEVDKAIGMDMLSKKQVLGKTGKSTKFDEFPSPWSAAEATKKTKFQREEAKISAWENLQKAKSEAAIRKLEMKLEKKRSASMDKILKKLETAQTKAQALRSSLSENHATRTSEASTPKKPRRRIFTKIRSLGHCFVPRRSRLVG